MSVPQDWAETEQRRTQIGQRAGPSCAAVVNRLKGPLWAEAQAEQDCEEVEGEVPYLKGGAISDVDRIGLMGGWADSITKTV